MSAKTQTIHRFGVGRRIEHAILLLSFTTLALTGLAQKYATSDISIFIISVFGGIETARIIHRIASIVFVVQSVLHFAVAGYLLYVRRLEASMLPGIKDGKDAIDTLKYNFGLSKEAPKMPRYNFAEKMEYWAMVWGLILMGLTGFMLWNPLITTRFLPGVVIPAAKVAHGLEAVLAVLAIILWHFYNVHIKHWNASMIKGGMTRHQMEEEHAEELAKIDAGAAAPPEISPAVRRRREMIYVPIATIIVLGLLGGIYWLVTAETTALETIAPASSSAPVFSPATPAAPTAAPETAAPTEETAPPAAPVAAAATTWDGGIGALFQTKCAACHGANAAGGLAVDTYANAIKGIVPNDPTTSQIIVSQEKGGHMGQFSPEELQQIIDWVKAGAPES